MARILSFGPTCIEEFDQKFRYRFRTVCIWADVDSPMSTQIAFFFSNNASQFAELYNVNESESYSLMFNQTSFVL